MRKPRSIMVSYEDKIDFHDHLRGAAHCLRCKGTCVATGGDLAYAALARAIFEAEHHTGATIPHLVLRQLQANGIDVDLLRRRAKA